MSYGDATLWIPAGSLSADAIIGLDPLHTLPAAEAGRFATAEQAYELTPHGTEFALASPAVLSVSVDRATMTAKGFDPRTSQLFHLDEETGAYVGVASTFDDRTGTLVAAIEHFSKYVVMAQAAASTAPGPTVSMQGTVPTAVRAGAPLYLRATIIPAAGTAIASVRIYYQKLQPAQQPLIEAVMEPDLTPSMPGSNTYGFVVPADFLAAADLGPGPDLAYYAEATDSLGVTTTLAATPTARSVTLVYAPGSLAVTPASLNISAGFERWLTVTGTDSAATVFQLVPDAASVSSCPGPSLQPIGEIDDQRASGVHFRARRACAGTLSVSSGGDVASIPVTVGAGHLESLALYRYEQVGPAEIRTELDGTYALPEGHVLELDALGRDGFGNTMPVNVAWSADPSIGAIDGNGRLYTLDGAGFGQVSASVGGLGGVSAAQWFNVVGRSWSAVGTTLNVHPLAAAGAMGAARYSHTATRLLDGTILVAGGYDGNGALASAAIYDPESNTWSAVGAMATPRYNHSATLLPNGRVAVASGHNASGIVATVETYDPGTKAWSSAGSVRRLRYDHTATLLQNGRVLITGSYLDVPSLVNAEVYDPATQDSLLAGSGSIDARRWHTATLLLDGRVLVTGGFNGSATVASAELYAPASNGWLSAGAMSVVRQDHTATLLRDGQVLVTGGHNGSVAVASTEIFHPQHGWRTAHAMGVARHQHTATLLPDGRVLVTGGNGGTGTHSSAELYDPATDTWTFSSGMGTARREHEATLLSSGRVVVTGGRHESSAHASAEIVSASEPAAEPSLAFSGATPYVAWHEANAVSNRIYVKHWTGAAWVQDGAPLNVALTHEASAPRIAFAGAVPYVAWQEAGGGGASQIQVKRWSGTAWVQDAPGSLNVATTRDAARPVIAVSGTTPHVAWDEEGPGARQIYVRRWNGTSWTQLGGSLGTSPVLDATRPSMAMAGATPYVAWEQETLAGTRVIEVKHWTGAAWVSDGPSIFVDPAADAREPMIAISGGVPYVTWRETLAGNTGIYVAHRASGAWIQDGGSLSNNPTGPISSPAIAFHGATPYVAWRETTGGAFQIHVKHLKGATWHQNGGSLNASAASAFAPALSFDGATPYAAWGEAAGALSTIRVKRLE